MTDAAKKKKTDAASKPPSSDSTTAGKNIKPSATERPSLKPGKQSNAPSPTPIKKSKFLDDDFPEVDFKSVEEKVAAELTGASAGVSPEKPAEKAAKPVPVPPKEMTAIKQWGPPPVGYCNVQSFNGRRMLIVDCMGKDWKDVVVYDFELGRNLHMKVEDLFPRSIVNDVCAYFASSK